MNTTMPPRGAPINTHHDINPEHFQRYLDALAQCVGDLEQTTPSIEACVLGSLIGRDSRAVYAEFSTCRFVAAQTASLATVDVAALERQMDEASAAENRAALELARVMREIVEPAQRGLSAAKAAASEARGAVAGHSAEVQMIRQQSESPVVAAILKANGVDLPSPIAMPEGQIDIGSKLIETYHEIAEKLQTASGPEAEALKARKLHIVTTLNKAIKSIPAGPERIAAEARLAAAMSPRIKPKNSK